MRDSGPLVDVEI